MSNFAQYNKNFKYSVNEQLSDYSDNISFKEMRSAYTTLHKNIACIAVATLLTETDTEKFQRICSRAAENWFQFLLLAKEKGKNLPTNNNLGLYCALAAGNFELARKIAENTSTSKTRWEYEDEFYLSKLFCIYFLNRNSLSDVKEECLEICDLIDDYLEYESYPVLFYRALFADDVSERFVPFIQWHDEAVEKYKTKDEKSLHSSESRVLESIWFQGLAVSLVESEQGVNLPKNLEFLPSLLFSDESVPLCSDLILGVSESIPSNL